MMEARPGFEPGMTVLQSTCDIETQYISTPFNQHYQKLRKIQLLSDADLCGGILGAFTENLRKQFLDE